MIAECSRQNSAKFTLVTAQAQSTITSSLHSEPEDTTDNLTCTPHHSTNWIDYHAKELQTVPEQALMQTVAVYKINATNPLQTPSYNPQATGSTNVAPHLTPVFQSATEKLMLKVAYPMRFILALKGIYQLHRHTNQLSKLNHNTQESNNYAIPEPNHFNYCTINNLI